MSCKAACAAHRKAARIAEQVRHVIPGYPIPLCNTACNTHQVGHSKSCRSDRCQRRKPEKRPPVEFHQTTFAAKGIPDLCRTHSLQGCRCPTRGDGPGACL